MARSSVLLFWLSSLSFSLLPGCVKHNANYVPPNAVDSFVKDPYGSIYINGYQLYKLDIQSGVTKWTTYNALVFDSYISPLYFDSGYFYSGGLYGIAAYNYQTGQLIWLQNTPATTGMLGYADYRAVAIKDSLAIYGGVTGSGYGVAYMYCVRKRNGTPVWTNLADSISYITDFTSIPYIAGGNVVTLTRNYNGDPQITAYDPATGRKRLREVPSHEQIIDEMMTEQQAWCKRENIISTPTILVNGYELPDAYSIESLPGLLN